MKKKLLSVLFIGMTFALAACGGGSDGYGSNSSMTYNGGMKTDSYEEGFYDEYEVSESAGSSAETPEVIDSSRKLIKDYDISIETENFDGIIPAIEKRVAELGGYIESQNTYYGQSYAYNDTRSSSLRIRIPKNKDEEFIKFIGNSSNITRQSLNVSDVTLKYVDMASRRDSYIVERDRLMELLEQADNLEDILVIEARLSEVRYSLESMESQLRTMDNLVDYSTVTLDVYEVKEYSEPAPETFGQRISSSFKNGIKSFIEGMQDFAVWFVGALPGILLFAVIITVIVLVVKRINKKRALKAKAGENSAGDKALAIKVSVKPESSSDMIEIKPREGKKDAE